MKIEELENKIKELQEELEKLKNKENKRWRAERGEKYWHITSNGGTEWFYEAYTIGDNSLYDFHNYFKTEKEAQATIDNIETHIELMELAEELNTEPIDWENYRQNKYSINYSYNSKEIYDGSNCWVKAANVIYCTNDKFKNEAIKRIGEERLIKYLKGE